MAEKPSCPVCNSSVDPNTTMCGICGFKLVGRTEQFSNVDSVSKGSVTRPKSAKNGTLTLTILDGHLKGESFNLTNFPLVIGRDPSCDLFLNDRTVTRRHASVDIIDNEVVICDLNSMNGTWIDGKSCDRAILKDGSIVQIGVFNMVFNI